VGHLSDLVAIRNPHFGLDSSCLKSTAKPFFQVIAIDPLDRASAGIEKNQNFHMSATCEGVKLVSSARLMHLDIVSRIRPVRGRERHAAKSLFLDWSE
jgi:hypothetical protein